MFVNDYRLKAEIIQICSGNMRRGGDIFMGANYPKLPLEQNPP
jgi:hypothetical protein